MSRPTPTWLYHFTSIEHLRSIVSDGLLADSIVDCRLVREAGNPSIKDQRRGARVSVAPGGMVADYVPFYFAPRSPMLYAILKGQVPTYGSDVGDLVYLVTTVERFVELGLRPIFTKRNAVLATADFFAAASELDDGVDWALMQSQYWNNTDTDPDRRARRMAECLVHQRVPWDAIVGVGTYDDNRRETVRQVLTSLGSTTDVGTTRDWYF